MEGLNKFAKKMFVINTRMSAILFSICLSVSCSKKSADSSTPAPAIDTANNSTAPTPTPSDDGSESPNINSGSLRLNISQTSKEFEAALSGTYSVSHTDLPSLEDGFNQALPAGFSTGSLAISTAHLNLLNAMNLADSCELLPPHANLRALTDANQRSALLGECRPVGTNSDVAASNCNNLINDNQWLDAQNITHSYRNGLWDRFFDGCGPTDIRSGLKSIDTEVFENIERLMGNGTFRCVDIPALHKRFSANIVGASFSDALGVSNYPFACTTTTDGVYQAFGKEDGYFYFWNAGVNGSIIKVKEDGKKMDILRTIGNVTGVEATDTTAGSMGLYRLISEENDDGDKSMFMTVIGSGIGPDCGGYLATKSSTTTDLMYIELKNPGAGSANSWASWKALCDAGSTLTFCFKGDFTAATGSDPTVLTACVNAGLTTPPTGFEKFAYNASSVDNTSGYVTPAAAAVVNRIPVNDDDLDFGDLAASNSINDPMKALMDRIFSNIVAAPYDIASTIADANAKVQQFLTTQRAQDPQCIYEVPVTFNHQGTNHFEPASELRLSCALSNGAAGIHGEAVHLWSIGDAGERFAISSEEGKLSIWKYEGDAAKSSQPWTSGDKQAAYTRLLQKTDTDGTVTQEIMLVGDNQRFQDLACGIHFRRVGNLFLVQGKFADNNCESRVFDEDCLLLNDGGGFTRKPLSNCRGNDVGDPFEFPTLLRENITPATLIALANQSAPSGTMAISTARTATSTTPAAEIPAAAAAPATDNPITTPVLALTAVESFPLTSKSKYFEKIATDAAPYGINCLHAGVGTHQKAIAGSYRLEIGDLSAAELTQLNQAITNGSAYVSVEVNRATDKIVGTVATPSVTANLAAVVLDGETEVRRIDSSNHSVSGPHLLTGFEDISFNANHVIEITWEGTATVACPSAHNSQALSVFNLKAAPRLRFN